ncbi:MAG: hypothetical protein FJY54_00180 [Betaproteobacteria bacterium]|nr:hypothetical protein [Betaproteobacteria bacterium]
MPKPLGNEDFSDKPGERVIDRPELPAQGITNENDVHTEIVSGEMQLKRGVAGKFEVFCDEPARIGGTDRYPSPMSYLAMAIGF